MRDAVALVVLTVVVAGCIGQNEPPPPTTPGPETTTPPAPIAIEVLEERFDGQDWLPDGWISGAGEWTIARDPSAPSAPHVLKGSAGDNVSNWIRAPVRFLEFDATLLFRIDGGVEGAGLVFAHADDEHDVVLYSPRDSTWRVVSYEDGQASALEETALPAGASEDWIALRVVLEGARLQVWQNSMLVLEVADMGDVRAGEMGAFVARGTTASFDDMRIEPLTH